jgi:FkbM family methyltransferase
MARWAGPNGKVFAFEPDAAMGDALRRNVRANCPRNVEVFLHAVGSRSETGVLHGSAFNSGDSRLHVTRFPITGCHPRPESDLVQSVPIRTLDQSLPGQRLDLIKIDVQGWEAHVLRGIVTLFELNPGLILYFEFWPAGLRAAGSSAAELKQLLADRKLRVYRPGGAVTTASIDLEEEERKMKPNGYVNLLARQA